MGWSRRDVLKSSGVFLAGALLDNMTSTLRESAAAPVAEKQGAPELPFPYKKIDARAAADIAHPHYYSGACCYGAFESIIGELRKEIGSPYTMIPTALWVVGEGGQAATGTLCGALNGASMAIFLVKGGLDKAKREDAFALIQELFNWYEQTPLPDYKPKAAKFDIVKSLSRSPLCHASVSTWCKTSGFKAFSKERSERCAWITASVVKFTVEMLNSDADAKLKLTHPLSAATKACRSCHDKGGAIENMRGTMDCGGCHFTSRSRHPDI